MPIKIHKLRGNVSVLEGSGGNVAVLTGRADTIAAKPTAAYDAKWGQFLIDPAFFTRLVYEGV